MSVPKFATYGLLAMGMVLSVVAALEISAPPHVQSESAAAQPAPDAMPTRVVAPVTPAFSDGPPPLVRLTGVVLGQGEARAALVSVNNEPPVLVRIGDPLSSASTVQAIGGDWMAYSHGTKVMRVRTQDGEPVAPSASSRLVAAASVAPAPAAAQLPTDAVNGNEEFRQAMKQKLASIKP